MRLLLSRQVLENIVVLVAAATAAVEVITGIQITRYQAGIRFVGSKQYYILCRQQIKNIK